MTLSDPIVGSLFITWWGGMILVVLQQKLTDPPHWQLVSQGALPP